MNISAIALNNFKIQNSNKTNKINKRWNMSKNYTNNEVEHIKDEENTPDNIILERKDNNSGVWEELMANSISDKTKELIWKDFSITQGVEYSYSLRSGNERVIKTITPDFEDMFLSDGER